MLDWPEAYRRGIEERVEDLAREILRLAGEVGADLLAAGSHGHGYFGRIVLGSTSSRLLHGAHCSLLLAPPADVPAELRETPRPSDSGRVEPPPADAAGAS